jgi:hypothetical protein
MPVKPQALHALQGDSFAGQGRVPSRCGRPKFPAEISGEAKRAFRRLCKMLVVRRALTPGDPRNPTALVRKPQVEKSQVW